MFGVERAEVEKRQPRLQARAPAFVSALWPQLLIAVARHNAGPSLLLTAYEKSDTKATNTDDFMKKSAFVCRRMFMGPLRANQRVEERQALGARGGRRPSFCGPAGWSLSETSQLSQLNKPLSTATSLIG